MVTIHKNSTFVFSEIVVGRIAVIPVKLVLAATAMISGPWDLVVPGPWDLVVSRPWDLVVPGPWDLVGLEGGVL